MMGNKTDINMKMLPLANKKMGIHLVCRLETECQKMYRFKHYISGINKMFLKEIVVKCI